jgi:putative transposase
MNAPGIPVTMPNQVWVADITYIRISIGFVYLAAILDAFSRKVVGHAVSRRLGMQVAIKALIMAISKRNPGGCSNNCVRQ